MSVVIEELNFLLSMVVLLVGILFLEGWNTQMDSQDTKKRFGSIMKQVYTAGFVFRFRQWNIVSYRVFNPLKMAEELSFLESRLLKEESVIRIRNNLNPAGISPSFSP